MPSPAFINLTPGIIFASSANIGSDDLIMNISTPIRLTVSIVSKTDSPFFIDEFLISKFIVWQPKFFAAISNESLVLVLGSKKTFAIVLSGKIFSLLQPPSPSKNCSANAINSSISFFDNSEMFIKFLFTYHHRINFNFNI